MYSTSAEWQTKADANTRRWYEKVVINYTDVTIDPTITGSSTDLNYISWPQQMVNGRTDMTYKWCELDGQMILDGTFNLCPSTEESANFNEMGWWSESVADGSGIIDVTAQITYSQRAVSGYYTSWDNKLNSYAIDYTVEFYNGVTLVYTDTVTGNSDVKRQHTFTQINNIDKCVLNVTKWSEPNTVVKCAEFTTQVIEEYTGETVCNFNVLEEREISNDNSIPVGNISASQASLCLINNQNRQFDANNTASRLFGLVKPNAYVEIYIGFDTTSGIEYVPVFRGWCTEWDVPEQDKTATTTARDRLELLTQTDITTSTVIQDNTFYDWFEIVLNDAGLANTQYNIDTVFQGTDYVVPYGWLENITHRRALEILAQGCSAVVYQDRDGLIQIKPIDAFPTGSVKTYTRDDYTDKNNQPIYENVANRISVTTQPLAKNTGVTIYQTLSTEPEEIALSTTDTYIIYYTDKPVTDHVVSISPAVPGVTITGSNNYSWGSEITVQNTNGTPQTFQFNVTGSTFTVQGQKTSVRSDAQSIEDNGLVRFDYPQNQFLQKKALSDKIAETLLASFKDAQRDLELSFNVGGNPSIELGDTITVTDAYGNKDYKIVSTEINYDGGLGLVHRGRV